MTSSDHRMLSAGGIDPQESCGIPGSGCPPHNPEGHSRGKHTHSEANTMLGLERSRCVPWRLSGMFCEGSGVVGDRDKCQEWNSS